jgi:hypothetical protein
MKGEMSMPLKEGSSRKTISANIKTLVHEYEHDGTIGSTHPGSKKKAIKQTVAISLAQAGKGRYKAGGRDR